MCGTIQSLGVRKVSKECETRAIFLCVTFTLPAHPEPGSELQVFHVAQSFLQNVQVNGEDCDVDLEISQTADRNAPE